VIAPPPPPLAVSAAKTVAVGDDVFAPTTLTVRKGTRVTFRWLGEHKHNVAVAEGPATFRSKSQRSGTYTRKVRKAGTYRLVCTIHAPDMQMTLTARR
jgi:plastocyanin